jgi:hypothetical protein
MAVPAVGQRIHPFAAVDHPGAHLITMGAILSDHSAKLDPSVFSLYEWEALLRQAEAHGAAPLIYWKLKELGVLGWLPPQVGAALQYSYYRSAAQNGLLREELVKILTVLSAQNIPVIVLKGSALGPALYPNLALRPINDIDLLVHRQDVIRAAEAVRQLGYVEASEHIFPVGSFLEQATNKHLVLAGPGGMLLELHWSLIGAENEPRSPDPHIVWSDLLPLPGGGCALRRELELLYLCTHVTVQHGLAQARLIWLYDIHLLLSSIELDWGVTVSLAQKLGWVSPLLASIQVVENLFGTSIPEGLVDQLKREPPGVLSRVVERKARAVPSRSLSTWYRWQDYPWRLRLRLVLAALLPRRDYIIYRYRPEPPWIWPLYYIYRWFDTITDSLKAVLRADQK